jgi:4-amino-4-deoxy-L-arabinose transferase-like glycosyltransferase
MNRPMKESVKTQLPEPEDGRSRRALYWIVAASVLIRLAFVLLFSGLTQNGLLDSVRYTRVALNLLAGNGYAEWGTHLTAFVPPGYPLFLAGCYGLFGVHPLLVKILQAVLGGFLPWIVFAMGRRLVRERTALTASAVTAVYPELVVLTGYLYTETFFILLECLFFLFLIEAHRTNRVRDWTVSGIFLGLGMLVRSLLLFFPPFLFLACAANRPLRTRLKGIVLMSLVGYALLLPWTVRNAIVFHRLIPVTTGGGKEFWIGSDIAHGGRFRHGETFEAIETLTAGAKSEPEKDGILLRAALRNIRENPAGYARVCLGKAVRYFFQIYENIPTGAARKPNRTILLVLAVTYYPLLLFGLAGFILSLRELQKWTPLIALFSYTLLLYSATHFVPRYRIPLVPFICLFAAHGLNCLVKSFPPGLKRRG